MKALVLILSIGGIMGSGLWHCPNCGESYFSDGCGVRTLAYYQPIWKDGVNINPDRNTTTFTRTCCSCGKSYVIQTGYEQYYCTEIKQEQQTPTTIDSESIICDTLKLEDIECDTFNTKTEENEE